MADSNMSLNIQRAAFRRKQEYCRTYACYARRFFLALSLVMNDKALGDGFSSLSFILHAIGVANA